MLWMLLFGLVKGEWSLYDSEKEVKLNCGFEKGEYSLF